MKINTYLALGCAVGALGIAWFYGRWNKGGVKGGSEKMILPLNNDITSAFGSRQHPIEGGEAFHNGVDIRGAVGDLIVSPADGRVENIYYNPAGGNQLLILHNNGYTSGYAHLSAYFVTKGQWVVRGQVIAAVGNTGNTTGPHLHLTLKNPSGAYVNPVAYLT